MSAAITLPAAPAPAAPSAPATVQDGTYSDPQYADSTTFEIEGRIVAAEVEHLGQKPTQEQAYAVATSDGSLVSITVDGELPANGRFSGELVVEGEVARSLRDEGLLPPAGRTITADSAGGEVALATADQQAAPVPVAEATVAGPVTTSATVAASAHRAYVVKMTDQGSVEGTTPELEARIDQMLSYWTAESDGAITSFTRQGPILDYDSAGDVAASQGCGILAPFTVWDDARTLFPGVDIYAPGNHLIVLMGDECGTSGPIGVATIGDSLASGGPSILTVDPHTFDSTGAHELGHNFGLQHANLDTCASAGICEYYDLYSPMALSLGGVTFAPPALGTLYRQELGLTTAAEVTSVSLPSGQGTSTATYELAARSASSGRRGLLVTDPSTGTTYSIDWRDHAARDANTFYGSAYGFTNTAVPTYRSGLVIERQATAAGLPGATFLMTHPVAGRAQGAFAAGETFAPTSGLSVAVNGIGSTASVTVTLTGTPLQSAVPTIDGTVAVGRTVTAVPGTWTDGTSFTYDWKVAGVSTGVTTQTYAVPATALGASLTVDVTGSRTGYAPATRTSAGTTVAKGTITAPTPTYTGAARVGETLTAQPGTWSPAASFTYAWVVGTETVGTSQTFSVPASALGQQLTLRVTGSATAYDDLTASSASATVGKGTFTAPRPTYEGTASVGATLTAKPGAWSPSAAFTYAWEAGGDTIGTGSTLVVPVPAAGQQLQLRVTGTATGYDDLTTSSVPATVAQGALTAATPTISGSVVVGETVTAVPGVWSPAVSFTYSWLRNGVPTGETGPTFTIPPAAVLEDLRVVVTGTADGYEPASRTSAAQAVGEGTLTAAAPTISGTPKVGATLTAVPGTWSPTATFTYAWTSGTETLGTDETLVVPPSAAGEVVQLSVTGDAEGYTEKTVTTTVTIRDGFTAVTPTITGTVAVGETVTAVPGTWTPAATFTYAWKVKGTTVGTGSTLLVPVSAAGETLTVSVTGSAADQDDLTVTSAGSVVAPGTLTSAAPTLSAAPTVGERVTAVLAGWTSGTSFTYDWKIAGVSTGVTTAFYDVAVAAAGQQLTLAVTGSKTGYASATTLSVGSTVLKGTFATAPTPAWSGNAKVGETLTATTGTWSPAATFTYAWVLGGETVGTSSTLVVPSSANGRQLQLTVSGSAAGYDDLMKTSAAVTVGKGTFTAPTPTISGPVTVGETVTAVTGTWSPSASFTYTWKVKGATVGTGPTLLVPASAAGEMLTVSVAGSAADREDLTVTSAGAVVSPGTLAAGTPTISGTPVVGGTLTAVEGGWTPGTALSFTWTSGSSVIGTGRSVTIPASAAGGAIRLVVSGTRTGYNPRTVSVATGTVAPGTLVSAVPTIKGTPKIGKKLKVSTGAWSPSPTLALQWFAGGKAVKGATGATFKVTKKQQGKKIMVAVTGTQSGYSTVTTTSRATKKVPKKK